MARKKTHVRLHVFLNGRLVGRLTKEPSGAIDFRYDPSWLGWEHTFAVSMSLPLREDRYTGARVVAVFENLLPDDEDVRRKVAAQSNAEGVDAYSLLAAIGRDCVGALQFLPEGADSGPAGRVAGEPVDDEQVAQIIADLGAAPLGIRKGREFRISIAGAQQKTALLFWQHGWHIPSGGAPTTHILKPQIGVRSDGIDLSRSVENEHLCMRLAQTLGLTVAKTEIRDFADERVLVVERFDRTWTQDGRLLRVPQEDCCQALSVPPALKYQADGGPGMRDLLDLFKASDTPEKDLAAVLRAQIIFWLLGATDGHAKNFSIFLRPGGGFELTPLYDVMSAQPLLDAKQLRRNEMKLAMSVGDNRHYIVDTIQPRHFVQAAKSARLPAQTVRGIFADLLNRAPGAIARAGEELPSGFPDSVWTSVVGGLEERLRVLEAADS
ncbi:MAG TPA: type II toxin-antitoxin system HipA family toxin [Gammaproteobacteria bacterium]|nr:type II toxin-antitoxin system HipA family toxin [Gammaproteobacteria bacterium]